MRKFLSIISVILMLFMLSLPIMAVDEDPYTVPGEVVLVEDPSAVPDQDETLYEWASNLWSFIFPSDVIEANADLFNMFTLVSVSLVVFVPLFVIFIGMTLLFVSFFRSRR